MLADSFMGMSAALQNTSALTLLLKHSVIQRALASMNEVDVSQ
ncbi:hypothetical protein VNPA120661_11140 [Pseudomonas aeruginosa]|uniref:Uncharacterized protein n=1 Tax=Pseudomonas aeruginosa TaxID=287 RepID=A0A2L1KF91_PSEAI|nr:hypothetical protein [Pseudomonas aeruginosa]AVE21004.1 Hypothetical protein [Pseudomonas aeruginosa]UGK55719.1 Hypothetical protein [Pseudomonas aeruginosa]GLE80801.1 hypothetical protein VNPA120661_11140 [Pseudomonas aeruginosa]